MTLAGSAEQQDQAAALREQTKDYWINNNVHRSSPVRLNAPALVRQIAYWYNEDPAGLRTEIREKDELLQTRFKSSPDGLRNKFTRTLLDYMIINLHEALKPRFREGAEEIFGIPNDVRVKPCIQDTILLFGNAFSEDLRQVKPASDFTGRQHDIFFNEYRSVTVQFPWYDLAIVTVRFELHAEYFTAFVSLDLRGLVTPADRPTHDADAVLEDLARYIRSVVNIPGPGTPEAPHQFFYVSFWEAFAGDLLKMTEVARFRQNEILKRMFADFRGVILSDRLLDFQTSSSKGVNWGGEAASKLLSLMNDARRYECTASYMLDGRALHMSALGPQAPEISDQERVPVTYILYIRQQTLANVFSSKPPTDKIDRNQQIDKVPSWQIGRLVDRIHLLGTVRLAALRDLEALRETGDSLAELELLLKEARQADFLVGDSETPREDGTKALTLIQDAQKHFNKVGSTFFARVKSDRGIMFRVEHSRYYVAQFRASIPALRLGRLEGYQKYDQFVERRLGASYDFIDRLGTRYERASNALQTLYQNYLAVRANQTGKAIQQLTDRSNKTGEEIKLLQRFAEAALIGVLVPYYIVSSMGHLAADPSHSPPAAYGGPSVTQAFSVIFLSALPGIAIYRLQPKSNGVKYRLRNATLMAIVASIFWILIYNNPQVSDLTGPLWQGFQRLIRGVVADFS